MLRAADKWAITTVIILIVLFVWGSWWTSSQPFVPNKQGQPATANQYERGASEATARQNQKTEKAERGQEPHWYNTFVEHTPEWVIAAFTIVLAASTTLLWDATKDIARDAADGRQRTERAYVKLSHANNFAFIQDSAFRVNFVAKNFGRTPARVIDVRIEMVQGGEPPPEPPTPPERDFRISSFLVAEDEFTRTLIWEMSVAEYNAMVAGTRPVWLYGYVDYTDVFGARHRAGYGRRYNHIAHDFVFITSDRYNYDRPHPDSGAA